MGASYVALPVDDEVKRWLRAEGAPAIPAERTHGRWPTPNELRAALDSLAGYTIAYRDNPYGGWDAEIVDAVRGYDGYSATIWTKHISNPEAPKEFSFDKPSIELALMILEKLSRVCGPFLLVDDSSVTPVVVVPGADISELAARYR
jgi:hypothetical protein